VILDIPTTSYYIENHILIARGSGISRGRVTDNQGPRQFRQGESVRPPTHAFFSNTPDHLEIQ
jgi:hypothetical protein